MPFRVLVTDHAWPSLAAERSILGAAGAEVVAAETGAEAELIRLAPGADAILTNWKPVTAAVLDAAPRCRLVARYGIGLDNIAVEHATRLGMLVTNVPDYCLEEVSDHTLALLLACARRVVAFADGTRQGAWDLEPGRRMARLRGQTLGLVGYGRIARVVAPKAAAFGLAVVAHTPHIAPDAAEPHGVATRDLERLLGESDYVSLHVPLTPATRGLIGEQALRRMKPTAFLINTSRGAVVDETALERALREGWIAGAALDLLAQEPPPPDHPLLALPNVIVTPHAAFYSTESVAELQRRAAEQVAEALAGRVPPHVVNPAVLRQPGCRLAAARA